MNEQIKIVDFYKDKEIFITGGLGFMGKVLIEKLLRSCSGIQKIYVLIRESAEKTASDRLFSMLKSPLFDRLRSECPLAFNKLVPIAGDVTYDGLGVSEHNKNIMQNVSVLFHSAATIRFKEPFSKSILINTNGTLNFLQFAEKFRNVAAVVHVSTIFCNLDQLVLEEKIYEPYADWREMIELAKNSRDDILEPFVKKYVPFNHNNYTLSKHLAEQVVHEFRQKLPVVVFRPSVVINTIAEPIPGWTDTLSGPLALAVGVGTGLIRITYADISGSSELIAVDVAIKAMIVAAYKKGIDKKPNQIDVYNFSEKYNAVHITNLGAALIHEHPFEKCLWRPSSSSTNCLPYYLINFFLFQILPALFIDGILIICRQKPFLLKMQKKIYNGIMAYRDFASGHFNIKCDQTLQLDRCVHSSEFHNFAFMHFHRADFKVYFSKCIKGLKLFFLNEPEESTTGARIRARILFWSDVIVKGIFYIIVARLILKIHIIKRLLE